jgi:hypothetical protein
LILLGTGASAMTGDWAGSRYVMAPEDAAQHAAWMLDEVGNCTFCIWSPIGWIGARRMSASLMAVNPHLAARRPAWPPPYSDWLEMPGQIRAWYVEATGHQPSTTDLGHHLYEWREEQVPAAEIRRRIFAAAGKPQ